ncbi:hypothetical protein F383_27674 [Gossypium arboreum]|uniref:Uncharacterized protein n=1 Tax=Gossypium arboreum TaxID=29729 RepID=A0A0B0PB39_GOSAR|nr:hypothetical protein F383_27674 [Gossypium arboreum]
MYKLQFIIGVEPGLGVLQRRCHNITKL